MTITIQVSNLEIFLDWLKKCPFVYTISSMQGGFVHVKYAVPLDKELPGIALQGGNKWKYHHYTL